MVDKGWSLFMETSGANQFKRGKKNPVGGATGERYTRRSADGTCLVSRRMIHPIRPEEFLQLQ
jgi:hypothetical protein